MTTQLCYLVRSKISYPRVRQRLTLAKVRLQRKRASLRRTTHTGQHLGQKVAWMNAGTYFTRLLRESATRSC
ncbi:hypothetical protein BDU57DRAFT_523519 [Ampelomyces quisqualis]|uniref:Uncharacterized protein n=1 Tax=Ampelomyces quisqualis TaxID=50730 RepID=A0A6A5QD23_AMPQU|nr:hypothetical protein BDU57DRAFT_523519 [Ampelomyces quisqualis]